MFLPSQFLFRSCICYTNSPDTSTVGHVFSNGTAAWHFAPVSSIARSENGTLTAQCTAVPLEEVRMSARVCAHGSGLEREGRGFEAALGRLAQLG